MTEEFVRTGEFKQFQQHCNERHNEIIREETDMRGEVKELRDCITRKFASLNRLMYLLMGGLIANLLLMLLRGGIGG